MREQKLPIARQPANGHRRVLWGRLFSNVVNKQNKVMIISNKEYEGLLAYKWSFKLITDPKFPIKETLSELEDSFINDLI